MQVTPRSTPMSNDFFCEDLVMKTFLQPFSSSADFKKSSWQLMAKNTLSTGKVTSWRLGQEQYG